MKDRTQQDRMMTRNGFFARSELLLGYETMRRMASVRVIIFGIGGVGSWAAEALVRTGIMQLTIVDGDKVATSNLNRQLTAMPDTIGERKVEVLRERLLRINPDADIIARFENFTKMNCETFILNDYDYVIDAIDSLQDKALLIRHATESQAQFYSAMGAALRLDPTRVCVSEFRRIEGDPLARSLRKFFKHEQYTSKTSTVVPQNGKFLCVYSSEPPLNDGRDKEKRINGSLMQVTAAFGLTLSSLIIRDIIESK